MSVNISGESGMLNVLNGQAAKEVTCCGVIKSRRNQKTVVFFMLEVDGHLSTDTEPTDAKEKCTVQLVVNLEGSDTQLQNYTQHMRVGTTVQCAEPDAIMRFISDDFVNRELNACEALDCSEVQYAELRALVAEGATKAKQLKQAVAKHSRVMVGKPSRRSRQREHRVSKGDLDILDKMEQNTKMWPVDTSLAADPTATLNEENDLSVCVLEETSSAQDVVSDVQQQLFNIPGEEAAPSARGPMSRGEYMHGRKQPQIRWLVRKLATLGPFVHVLDIGGGRGDLAVLIAQTFPHALVTVVDANMSSLCQGKAFAKRCGEEVYRRIRFVCARFEANFSFDGVHILSDADLPEHDSSGAVQRDEPATGKSTPTPAILMPKVDVVVALHACGGLSDLALHYAATHQCRFLVCPCCYLKTPYCMPTCASAPIVSLTAESVPNESEYAERLALLRLAESDNRACSIRASVIINSQRLNALESILQNQPSEDDNAQDHWQLQLSEFPKEYSLRNLVLSSILT